MEYLKCVVVVAHPDDETLWAGGTILMHADSSWTVAALTRRSDPDRAPKFQKALQRLNAVGALGDLDDAPEQKPLHPRDVEETILDLLPSKRFDLIITHGRRGEYTSHRRHEEVCRAVLSLHESGRLSAREVWLFAYEDGGRAYLPRPLADADVRIFLPEEIWEKKYKIMTEVYGFACDSFEAKTTPREEAFWVIGERG